MANKKLHSWIKNIRMEWGFDSLAAISRTAAFGTIVALGSMLSSCHDLMHDDLPPCDMGVDLQFKYDYNVQRADMFNDHVGGVCVFVFDEQGNLVARQDAANEGKTHPLKDPNYAMRIDLQPGKYRFATFAFQKKYEEALSQAGAKFHIEAPAAGESIEKLRTRLDRNAGKVENQTLPLDIAITIECRTFSSRIEDKIQLNLYACKFQVSCYLCIFITTFFYFCIDDITVRPFDIEEAKVILKTKSQQLSLQEMYLVAQTYEPGSPEFNEVFDIAVRLFPDDETANLNAACTDLQKGDLVTAEKHLAKAGNSKEAERIRKIYEEMKAEQ